MTNYITVIKNHHILIPHSNISEFDSTLNILKKVLN